MTDGVPPELDAQRRLGPEWADWLDRLPRLRDELLEEWALTPDGEPDPRLLLPRPPRPGR